MSNSITTTTSSRKLRMPRKARSLGFLQWLDKMPPFWVYFMARNRGIEREEIVKLSGLSLRTIGRLWLKITWAGIRAGVIEKFCLACGPTPWQHNERDYHFIWQMQNKTERPFKNLSTRERRYLDLCCRRYQAAKMVRESGVS